MFPGLRIEALPLFTVQGKCIYTFFKAKNQKIQCPLLCSTPSKDKHKFLLSKDGSPGANISASFALHVLLVQPIYQPTMTQQLNGAGRFIGQMCQLDKIFEPIYQPTAVKGIK